MSPNSESESEPSNAELMALARSIAGQFEALHRENAERDAIVMQRVDEIHAATIRMANDLVTMALQRNEIVTKTAKRAAWLTERTAKIVVGSVALVLVTLWMISVADPADLADTIRRLLPVLGLVWTGYIAVLLGVKPPSIPPAPDRVLVPAPVPVPDSAAVPRESRDSGNDANQPAGGRQ